MSSLNIATRALNTNLAALQVIGHNIANVNTDGYSRQNVLLQSAGYQAMGSGYFGKGVEIGSIERSHSEYLTREARLTSSVAAADQVRFSRLQQLESVFPIGSQGLGVALNDMLNAWNDVTSSPTNLTAREVVLARADEFASRLRASAGQLDMLKLSTEQQVQSSVDAVNRLAQNLASVNKRLTEAAGSTQTPNDLLDERDQLLREINRYVQTSTVAADNGAVSVFVGGSQPLVLGTQANSLAVTRDPIDTSRIGVTFRQASASSQVPDTALGGELGGLMHFLNQDLLSVQNQLGRMALATAETVNAQHQLGVDLRGNPGQAFFVPPPAASGIGAPTNTGSATVGATVSDPTALIASDYELRFGTGTVSVVRLSDGNATSFGPPVPTTLTVDGLDFNLAGGAAANGDVFRVRPFEAVARNLSVAIGAPERLAAASPVKVEPGTTNSGGLAIEGLYAVDAHPNLTDPVTITFNPDGTYSATGLGPGNPPPDNAGPPASYNFVAGQPIVLNGWSLTLRGSPTAGDSFSVSSTPLTSIAQNAGNANGVLALRDLATFEGVPLSDGYVSLFSDLGTRVQGAEFAASFSTNIAQAAETARTNVAGVNLDEEAARLLQFQQAYQASAKFLQIAQSTFDSLLQTVGR